MANTDAKTDKRILRKRRFTLQKLSKINLVKQLKRFFWNVPKNSYSKVFRET